MSKVIKGKILHTIKQGIHAFTEIEEKSRLGSPTVSKYLRELEREGLIVVELDKLTRKPRYKLNESRIEEINNLIEKYIDSEEEQILRSYSAIQGYNPERAKNLLRRLEENIGKHTSTTLDRHEGFRKFPSSIKDLVEEKK